MEVEVGDEEGFGLRGADERESVRAGKFGAGPLMHQLAAFVVDDDIIGDVVGQQHDVTVGRAGESVAVVDRRLRVEHAPAGHDAILEVTLAEDFG